MENELAVAHNMPRYLELTIFNIDDDASSNDDTMIKIFDLMWHPSLIGFKGF